MDQKALEVDQKMSGAGIVKKTAPRRPPKIYIHSIFIMMIVIIFLEWSFFDPHNFVSLFSTITSEFACSIKNEHCNQHTEEHSEMHVS